MYISIYISSSIEAAAKGLYDEEQKAEEVLSRGLDLLRVSQMMVPVVHDAGPPEFKVNIITTSYV